MMKNDSITSVSQWLVAAIFAVLSIVVLYIFVTFAEPEERKPGSKFEENYSEAPLEQALTAQGFRDQVARIQAVSVVPGSRQEGRLSGSPGCEKTRDLILKTFKEAGLQTYTQRFQVVVPETEYCEILDRNGHPLPGVTLYPFEPKGLVPLVLDKDGITGTLVATDSSAPLDLLGKNIENNIVVNSGTDASWATMASMGAKAVIYTLDPTERTTPDNPVPWSSLVIGYDIAFPCFYVRGPIEQYLDQGVRIRCKVTWKSKEAKNVIGVLRAEQPTREALVLTAFYDSYSVIPELAPGGEQSLSLAALLQFAKAMAPYRDEPKRKRDVIFVATAGHCQSLEGAIKLMEAIENFTRGLKNYRSLEARIKDEEREQAYVMDALNLVGSDDAWRATDNARFAVGWRKRDPGFRKWFEKCYATVTGEINLDLREELLAARLKWIEAGRPTYRPGFDPRSATQEEKSSVANRHELLQAYLDAKERDTRTGNAIATPFWMLASEMHATGEFEQWRYRDKLREYFEELQGYHVRRIAELEDARTMREEVFGPYQTTLTLNLELYSGGSKGWKDLAVLMGRQLPGTVVEPQSTDLRNAIAEKVPQADGNPEFVVTSWGTKDAAGSPNDANPHSQNYSDLESEVWFTSVRLAFTILNKQFLPPKVGTPEDTFANLGTDVPAMQLAPIARAALSIAFGKITFKSMSYVPGRSVSSIRGTVYTQAGTASLVPTHRMGRNTFVHAYIIGNFANPNSVRGIRLNPIIQANPYGEYERRFNLDLVWIVTIDAARFGEDGKLRYYKDASAASQGVFKNESVPGNNFAVGNEKDANLALFRCAPVACFQRGNPKTLNSFKGFAFLNAQGLDAPEREHVVGGASEGGAPGVIAYLEPDMQFYVALQDGIPNNPDILAYRAFMLNVDPHQPLSARGGVEPELAGRGYLAASTPNLTFPYFDAAASMLRTNAKRLELQKQYGMADKQMLKSQKDGVLWYEEAEMLRKKGDAISAVNAAGKSLAFTINNHPVIRANISQAVFGILWYLGLLVPFAFFLEKLLFGFTDIRKELLAVGAFFIVVFALLQTFHPAFRMVRSPVMILLGFLILMLTILVTVLVSGRFKENLKALRRREGYVEGADINRGGVIGTAFMLGLNNMRRRKVRTGLTCVTLFLITFAMICFASVTTDVQETEYATGRSPSNGLLRRDAHFAPLTDNEINNLRLMYVKYPVTTHQWLTGVLNPLALQNANILIDYVFKAAGNEQQRRAKVNAAIVMEWIEPQFSGIDHYLVTHRGWFPRPPQTREEKAQALASGQTMKNYVMLPDTVAHELGITKEEVDAGVVTVTIRAEEYEVLGIFDSLRLSGHLGMDGQSILPYDLNSIQQLGTMASTGQAAVPQDVERLKGSQVIICSKAPTLEQTNQLFTVSCAVLFPSERYRLRPDLPWNEGVPISTQRMEIAEYLERIGDYAYYAIDGIMYQGRRTRGKEIGGLLELLIPLLIAAVTVFNTMRGSVYERRDEIYVYNAVGIAPNHVFFMFMAEASVYAVIGAMTGYLLSQIVGTVLSAAGLTTGLNMDYSSIETIYASIAIVVSVLLSTLVPARTASRLALPSDEVSWTIPKAEDGVMHFNLPFTFSAHDRVAVVSYFYRWLDANGEGSSGSFFCSPPGPRLDVDERETRSAGLVPGIEATIWLKPFDLGVSQRLQISLPTDPQTGEYIATITIERLSGTTAAWNRAIMPFLVALRKQFLNWRAVTTEERQAMFEEARSIFADLESRETVHA